MTRWTGWRQPSILGAAAVAMTAGYAQFSMTTILGDVADAFGEAGATGGEPISEIGLGLTTLGIGLAIIRLAGMGALPAAAWADRRGRRPLLLGLAAVGLVLTLVGAAAPGFWVLVLLMASARPLLSGCNTIASVLAAEVTTARDRTAALAVVAGAYAFGSGVVAVVHGVASEALGFRGVLAIAAVGLLVLPVAARHIVEPRIYLEATAAHMVRPRRLLSAEPELRRRLLLLVGLAAAAAVVVGPAFTFLFVYGENILGVAPGSMAVLVVAAGPVGLAGLLAGRWAADTVGRRLTAGVATALTAVAATVAYSGSFPALVVGYLAAIAGSAGFGPAGFALLAELFPTERRATAQGWAAAIGVLGSVTGLAAFGALADLLGGVPSAAALLWLPVVPLSLLYGLVPETRGRELDELVPGSAQSP